MAREWLLRGVDPEELKRDTEIIPETPRSKWENFWYHHKWTFWGVLFLVVALTVATVQIATQDKPDYRIVLMSKNAYVSEQTWWIGHILQPYGEDLDGDGKVEINVQSCLYSKEATLEHNSGPQMVSAHLAAGDVLFFVWDESAYDMFMSSIENVSNAGKDFLSDIPADSEWVMEEGKIYSWEQDPRREDELVEYFPEKMYFGIRAPIGSASQSAELNQQCLELLTRFIEDNPVEE